LNSSQCRRRREMLATDPRCLKFLGLDLRPRARRRWAVALVYVAYMAVTISATHQVFPDGRVVIWVASVAVAFFGIFGHTGPVKSFDEPQIAFASEVPDERELSQRNRASYLSLRVLAVMFVCNAVGFSEGRARPPA
jgi:cytochrome c oxidase assembly factor CtaG